jgi:hypothetical protein
VQDWKKSYAFRRTLNFLTQASPKIPISPRHLGEQRGQSPDIAGGSAIASPFVKARFDGRPARRILYNKAR